MLYQDKSLEEVRDIVEKFKENYKRVFGVELSKEQIQQKLDELIKQKEQNLFESVFNTLNPASLRVAYKQFDNDNHSHLEATNETNKAKKKGKKNEQIP